MAAFLFFAVQIDRENGMQLFHTRRARDRSDAEITRTAATRANPMIFDNSLVYWDGNNRIYCSFRTGVSLYVYIRSAWFNTVAFVSHQYRGRAVGLLGNGDGNRGNDFSNRTGTVIPRTSGSRAIYNHMLNCKSIVFFIIIVKLMRIDVIRFTFYYHGIYTLLDPDYSLENVLISYSIQKSNLVSIFFCLQKDSTVIL